MLCHKNREYNIRKRSKINTSISEIVKIDSNGSLYLEKGLPEKRFLSALPSSIQNLLSKANLEKDELQASLGVLKRKNAIEFGKEINITSEGKKLLKEGFEEELFLENLPKETKGLNNKEKDLMNLLLKRKDLIKVDNVKEVSINLTSLGKRLTKTKFDEDILENVSSEVLLKGLWKDKKFRRYDVKSVVPRIYPGRRHFVNDAIDYIKRIWLDMGFEEMQGNFVQTSFWNFDALFTPQDHPARDLQDTFYIDNSPGKLPSRDVVNNVKKSHEKGVSGSKGWGYSWNDKEAKKNVLRTHTTVLSAQTISMLKETNLPSKFFSVGKVFRNETVDWKHSFEFEQTEGIVVSEDVNFRNLLGYLKEFFNKMGFDKVRFRPAMFPYTSLSTEIEVFHPVKKQWIELGGSGIFRPEVVVPLLGKDVPVLAWGLGVGRIIMDYYDLHDLRKLYNNDIKQMREMKTWIR